MHLLSSVLATASILGVLIVAVIGRLSTPGPAREPFTRWVTGDFIADIPRGAHAIADAWRYLEDVQRVRQARMQPWLHDDGESPHRRLWE